MSMAKAHKNINLSEQHHNPGQDLHTGPAAILHLPRIRHSQISVFASKKAITLQRVD